jgi:adenine nucleotide transporter 17
LIERLHARKSVASAGAKGKSEAVTLSAGEDLAAGMLAGVASRFFTTPLSNVTVRHQTSSTAKEKSDGDAKGKGKASNDSDSDDDEGEYSDEPGIVETLKEIIGEKGIAGE